MGAKSISVLRSVLRWAARVTGLMLVGLALAIMIGEGGPPNVFSESIPVQLEFAALMLMLIGFCIGWRWELLGGLLSVLGFVGFTMTELAVNGSLPGGAIPYFLIPGVLFLVSFRLARSKVPNSC